MNSDLGINMKLVLGGILSVIVIAGLGGAYATDNIIPTWIKGIATLWGDGEIEDQEFINAIEYLVNEGIIKIDSQKMTFDKSDSTQTNTYTLNDDLEKFPYQLEKTAIWEDCKVSIVGFVERLEEPRNNYSLKVFVKNIGIDVVDKCNMKGQGVGVVHTIHIETENGLNLKIYHNNRQSSEIITILDLYPGESRTVSEFGNFELNHDDIVKRVAITFMADEYREREQYGDDYYYTKYFEFKIIER